MNVSYQEFSPSAALQPYIDCYWTLSLGGSAAEMSPEQYCLPLGTQDLIFMLNKDRYETVIEGKRHIMPSALVGGMYQVPVGWTAPCDTRIFAIRMKPECMLELFRVPVSVLFNEFTAMDAFFGKSGAELTEQMREAAGTGDRIKVAETFLQAYLRDRKCERNYVLEATQLIRRSAGNISLDDLSHQLYVSTRQLQRSFKDAMGASPKTYMRIVRFANAYDYVQQTYDSLNWAALSYHFGYSDQAHFIRDFKQFTGKAPTVVVEEKTAFYQLSRQLV